MKFDKEIFDLHFGARYKKGYRVSTLLFLVFLLLFLGLILFHIKISFSLAIIIGIIIVLSALFIPIFYCAYKRRLEQSKRQSVWFENNKLFVELVPDNGWTWGFIEKHCKKYEIVSLEKIEKNNEYIKIYGKIILVDSFNGNVSSRDVNSVNIPRCFLNEEIILRLEPNNYGNG